MYKTILFLITAAIMFFGASVSTQAGVTNIKEILNDTGMSVEVRKYDKKTLGAASEFETTNEIPGGGGTWSGDMWIPWVDSSSDFAEKHLEILINGRTVFWVWQSGDFVRYNTRARFVQNAPRVFGESKVNGERRLIISIHNKKPVFEFQKF